MQRMQTETRVTKPGGACTSRPARHVGSWHVTPWRLPAAVELLRHAPCTCLAPLVWYQHPPCQHCPAGAHCVCCLGCPEPQGPAGCLAGLPPGDRQVSRAAHPLLHLQLASSEAWWGSFKSAWFVTGYCASLPSHAALTGTGMPPHLLQGFWQRLHHRAADARQQRAGCRHLCGCGRDSPVCLRSVWHC